MTKQSLKRLIVLVTLCSALGFVYLRFFSSAGRRQTFVTHWQDQYATAQASPVSPAPALRQTSYFQDLANAALTQTKSTVIYDPAYVIIPFPNGDVPPDRGVCSDVIIRAYRSMGTDLQLLLNLDMKQNFALYPQVWKLSKPDTNIDHRRVPNLMTFFQRQGAAISISNNPKDYQTGDMIAWDLGGGITHIGFAIWTDPAAPRPMIVHNIGRGPQLEDVLFNWKIIGAFRYRPQ